MKTGKTEVDKDVIQGGNLGRTNNDGRRQSRRRRVMGLILLFIVVVIPVILFVGTWGLLSYDESHVVSRECLVDSAESSSGSSRSLRGAGSSGPQVAIESSDCGTLLLKKGVFWENVDGLADAISREARVRVTVGAGSDDIRPFLRAIGASTEVYSVSPIP